MSRLLVRNGVRSHLRSQNAATMVVNRMNKLVSPARYSLTSTGKLVTVSPANAAHEALCTPCAIAACASAAIRRSP